MTKSQFDELAQIFLGLYQRVVIDSSHLQMIGHMLRHIQIALYIEYKFTLKLSQFNFQ